MASPLTTCDSDSTDSQRKLSVRRLFAVEYPLDIQNLLAIFNVNYPANTNGLSCELCSARSTTLHLCPAYKDQIIRERQVRMRGTEQQHKAFHSGPFFWVSEPL